MANTLNLPPHINGDSIDKYLFKIQSGTDELSPVNLIGASITITIRERNRNGKVLKKWTETDGIFENKKLGEIKFPQEELSGPIGTLFYSIHFKDDNMSKTLVEGTWSLVHNIKS